MFSLSKFINLPQLIKRRVYFLWGLNFLYQVGFMIAWVVITALFLKSFGVSNLIFLFLIEAILLLLGSLFGRSFFLKHSVEKFLYVITSIITLSLVLLYLFQDIPFLFFGIAFIAKSLLYPQFHIAFIRKTESYFSPNSAKKAIPVIESAETIGTIFGSLFIIASLFLIEAHQLLFLWIIPLLGMLSLFVFENNIVDNIRDLDEKFENDKEELSWKALKRIKHSPFVILLAAMILAKGMLFTVVEYEFTKDVNQHFTERKQIELPWQELQANIFTNPKQKIDEIKANTEKAFRYTVSEVKTHSIAQENIAHDLGVLSLIFGLIALAMKLFITTPLVDRFGVFKTVFIYFGGFISVAIFLLTGKGNMNIVRGYEHGFHSLFASPYHLSFYSADPRDREILRHGLEGIVAPIGMLGGVFLIFTSQAAGISPAIIMVTISAILAALVFYMHHDHIYFAIHNLFSTKKIEDKIHILETLGHQSNDVASHLLGSYLLDKSHHKIVREKTIHALKVINNPTVIHAYLQMLNEPEEHHEIKIKVLEAMLQTPSLQKYCQSRVFTESKLLETLQNLFAQTKNRHLQKLLIMNIFEHISPKKTVHFFDDLLHRGDKEITSICLRCAMKFDDPEVVNYIKPFIDHTDSKVRSHAIMACATFDHHHELRKKLVDMVESKDVEEQISGIYALGELQVTKYGKKIVEVLETSTNDKLQIHCLIALLKMQKLVALPHLLSVILGDNEDLSLMAFRMRKRLPEDVRQRLESVVHIAISKRVHQILHVEKVRKINDISKLGKKQITLLKRLYSFAERYENMYLLEQISS